jgi:transposase-like protein
METEVKRTQKNYTLAFKLSVVDQVEKGEMTYKEAQRRYGIQGRSTVLVWLRKHGVYKRHWLASSVDSGEAMDEVEKPPQSPDQRIKELEAQLKEAQQKAQLFEAVIDVLKKDYGVSIAKKPSGRFSRKGSSKG